MKRSIFVFTVLALGSTTLSNPAYAARVRVHRGPAGHVRVTVRPGFPIVRVLPDVVVRTGPVVRVAPVRYLAPVAFRASVVTSLPARDRRIWTGRETLEREDGWTDFSMNVDRRGGSLFLQIDRGAAQISFAEVVFENGETQVVDFNDATHRTGTYSLLDFRDGRKVDHVRIVARADTRRSDITLHLAT
jgi:hypothetical protein